MQLYSIEVGRKVVTSAGTTTTPMRLSDLPYSTALAYRNSFPDNEVKITAQDGVSSEAPRERRAPRDSERRSAPAATVISGGDYADAINAAMEH